MNNETNQTKTRPDKVVGKEIKLFADIVARRKDAERAIFDQCGELVRLRNMLNALIQIFEVSGVMPSPEHVDRVEMILDSFRANQTFETIRDNFDLYENTFRELDAAFRAEAAAAPPPEIKDLVREINNR